MNGYRILAVLALALLLVSGASALRMVGGEDTTVIADATDDDVIASRGTLVVDAPVGSLIAAGGEVRVNGPVAGDVIAAGGVVLVNGTVGGKVVLAGGRVTLNGTVQRNAVVTGGEVVLGPGARIGRDAEVSGGTVIHQGAVNGTLGVQAGTFENSGTAGTLRVDAADGRGGRDNRTGNWTGFERDPFAGLGALIATIAAVVAFLVTLGYLVLGLLLLALFPGAAGAVEARVRDQPIPAFVIGLVALVVAVVLGLILLVTVVGIPIAVLGWLLVIAGVMLAGLVVSLALGRLIAGKTSIGDNRYVLFIIGFVILNVVYLIPFLGGLVKFVVVCLGFGALVMAATDLVSGRRREAL
jgi:hypothetical protein